jgi:hypothetical protein
MAIHSDGADDVDEGCMDSEVLLCAPLTIIHTDFYNYFQHGIDVLISGVTHKVQKVILHSNVVRPPLFNPTVSVQPINVSLVVLRR